MHKLLSYRSRIQYPGPVAIDAEEVHLFMFTFLRSIRLKLWREGRIRSYLGHAAGEILLIVLGILIALQINNWNQSRRDRAEETSYLIRLKSDFLENQEELLENQARWQLIADNLRAFLGIMRPQPDSHPDALIHNYMLFLYHIPGYKPNKGVVNSLISSGKMGLIRNENLNYALNAWPAEMEKYEYAYHIISEMVYDYLVLFPKYHQFRDSMIQVNETLGHVGPSQFSYDQEALLSLPELENAAEMKRVNTDILLLTIGDLLLLQQDILDLIDRELAVRD